MRPKPQTITRLDYCQYLLVSQINYTLTNFADHSEKFSHDALNRFLDGEKLERGKSGGSNAQKVFDF
jgi:hypothetical protein